MKYVLPVIWGVVRWGAGLFFGWIMGAISLWLLTFVLAIAAPPSFYAIVALCVFVGTGFLAARSLDFYNTVTARTDGIVAVIVFIGATIGLFGSVV